MESVFKWYNQNLGAQFCTWHENGRHWEVMGWVGSLINFLYLWTKNKALSKCIGPNLKSHQFPKMSVCNPTKRVTATLLINNWHLETGGIISGLMGVTPWLYLWHIDSSLMLAISPAKKTLIKAFIIFHGHFYFRMFICYFMKN